LAIKNFDDSASKTVLESKTLQSQFLSYFRYNTVPEHFPFTVKLPKRYSLTKGCIIDLETTGFLPNYSNIVTMGVLEKDTAAVYQLTVPKYKEFQDYCFKKARETEEPRFSYNCRFESEFLQMEKGWRDLMQYTTIDRFPVCERGLKIAKSKETQVRQMDNDNYQVHSQGGDQWYNVNLSGDPIDWSCDCSFYQTFFEKCKHIWAVEFSFRGLEIQQIKRDALIAKYMKKLGKCTYAEFEEPPFSGRDVPYIWEQWLTTHNAEILSNITLHCLSDLLRERQLVTE
jgi:hypothetical protein